MSVKKPECTWGNHCLSEWCCPNMIENMFCICARNYDDVIETCDHDTRLSHKDTHPIPRRDVIEELERWKTIPYYSSMQYQSLIDRAIALIRDGVKK
jgi:hypothetical protein